MAKKILFGLVAALIVAGGVAALSAFEAHIINVTAHVENALTTHGSPIHFGTVFPQEYRKQNFDVQLSKSFQEQSAVDTVEYEINQKTKCKATDPENPVKYASVSPYPPHDCPGGYAPMLSLCPFLSKLPVYEEPGDVGELSYFRGTSCVWPPSPTDPVAKGILSFIGDDYIDEWTVDLKVPPVAGYVGQDWPQGCPTVPTNDVDYGCDLWIEVTDIYLYD